ncbi:hypothetical protein [Eisenbergiella massiliensis]|uniref:hypothetical protein n=1 Tax=Eisenbergiella massiliensis TaxID=1720294 RepID=UPI0023F21002|nr:hypothetical protein [Eisenbergiella massiliensis]
MDRVAESMNKMEKIRQFNLFLVRREIKRQGTYALYDNLYPSRIITGVPEEDEEINRKAGLYVNLVQEGAVKKDIPTFYQPDGSRSSNSTIAIDGYPPPRFAAPPLLPPKVFQQPLYRTVLHIFDK